MESKLQIQSDNITANVKKEVTTIKNDLDQNYYDKSETDSKFQIQSDSITSTVKKEVTTQIGNIEIGGRNILKNSKNGIVCTGTDYSSTTTPGATITTKATGIGNSYRFIEDFYTTPVSELSKRIGTEFAFSLDVKITGSFTNLRANVDFSDTSHNTSIFSNFFGINGLEVGKWTRVSGVASVKEVANVTATLSIFSLNWSNSTVGSTIEYRNLQLEEGNKSTAWTPAPEDMATADSLADVNSSLTDATNDLQSNINSTNKNLQDIQNSQNEVYEIVSQNKSQISSLTQRAEGFTMDFKTVNETVKQINNQFVTERDERYKYIKFIDGEIWLGKEVPIGEDDFKLVIKNDRISFLQNKTEVAYMSNNKLYVTDIHVTSSLQLGRFVLSSRANGNVGLRWIGN